VHGLPRDVDVLTPIAGKLGDLFGRKPFLLAGMIGFVSLGPLRQAQNMAELIAFRALQESSAACSSRACSPPSATSTHPPARELQACSPASSHRIGRRPVIGGYLTDNLTWRWSST